MRRAIKLNGLNKELELKKVNSIKHNGKEFIYFEKMDSGDWRMTYTEKTIQDIQQLKSLEIIREN